MSELISIIVPVYNVENELKRCIESILNQTYTNIEILLINDGSTDNCPTICDDFAKMDTRIKVIHTENKGVSAARNTGILQALGEYIGFVDSDDYIESAMFEKMHSWITKENAEVSICGWYINKNDETYINHQKINGSILNREDALFLAIRGGYYDGYLWNKLFRSSLLKSENGTLKFEMDTSLSICEDLLYICQVFSTCNKFIYNNIPLYNYVIRKQSAIKTFNKNKLTEFVARKKIIDLTKNISKKLYNISKFTYVQSTLSNYRELYVAGNKDLAKKVRKLGHQYIDQVFFPKNVSIKTRIRIITMYIAPKISVDIWLTLKKMFPRLQWEYTIRERNSLSTKGEPNDD